MGVDRPDRTIFHDVQGPPPSQVLKDMNLEVLNHYSLPVEEVHHESPLFGKNGHWMGLIDP